MMITSCEECTRLWREYATAAAQHIHIKDLLRRAVLAHRVDGVAELMAKSKAAGDAHENAREAIHQHESMQHVAAEMAVRTIEEITDTNQRRIALAICGKS